MLICWHYQKCNNGWKPYCVSYLCELIEKPYTLRKTTTTYFPKVSYLCELIEKPYTLRKPPLTFRKSWSQDNQSITTSQVSVAPSTGTNVINRKNPLSLITFEKYRKTTHFAKTTTHWSKVWATQRRGFFPGFKSWKSTKAQVTCTIQTYSIRA